ncbi:hypothetical protein HPULCUR_002831 [Helicostylum pulchrum]|uniref:Uncharacterized protein n=1 Tax=Helicostylum pulchrum TaxID=562976 RepID=A0ABP9XRN3_9FUNG
MALDFTFITRVNLLDKTFASIEKKFLRQSQINEWRIDVAPSHIDEMNQYFNVTSTCTSNSTTTTNNATSLIPPTTYSTNRNTTPSTAGTVVFKDHTAV